MKQDHPWIGVDAIILSDDKAKVLLIKRGSKTYHGMWGLVSGKVDWGEEVKEAVIREAREEVNLNVEVVRFVGRYYDKKGRHPTKTMICLPHVCRVIGGRLKAGSDAEDAKWFSFDEIRKMDLSFDHKQMLMDEGLL